MSPRGWIVTGILVCLTVMRVPVVGQQQVGDSASFSPTRAAASYPALKSSSRVRH